MEEPAIRITGDSMFVAERTLPSGVIDEELMALDARKGEVLGLDPIGTAIWQQAETPVSFDQLLDFVERDYAVTREQARRDLEPFLADLVSSGLLKQLA